MRMMKKIVFVLMVFPGLCWAQTASTPQYGFEEYPLSLKAQKVTVLNAPIDGVIAQVNVRSQDFVAKGDVLVQLDDELITLQVARIQTQIDRDVSEQEAAINLAYSSETFEVVEKIFNQKIGENQLSAVSKKEFSEAKQRLEVARLGHQKAELAMLMLKNELKINQHTLRKYSIRAPMAGVVVPFSSIASLEGRLLKALEAGESVRAGQEVMALMKVDRLRVSPALPASALPTVRLGQKAHVFVQGDSAGPYVGEVVYISPIIEVGDFTVEVEFDNPEAKGSAKAGGYRYQFRDGMRARVDFKLGQK